MTAPAPPGTDPSDAARPDPGQPDASRTAAAPPSTSPPASTPPDPPDDAQPGPSPSGPAHAAAARSRDAGHFDRLYASSPDPWGFRTSPYERAKYDHTLSALGGRRFRSALEVGCSIGELSARLAPCCDHLLGLDISAAPLPAAAGRCQAWPGASFRQMAVPRDWPEGRFDLVVLSEVLYFLDRRDLLALAERCLGCLDRDGLVLLVTWTGRTDDPTPGDDAAGLFTRACRPRLHPRLQARRPGYRLDLLGEAGRTIAGPGG